MSASTSLWWFSSLIALLAVERLFELRLSERNARWALERGGVEYGRGHLGWMKALHAGLFVAALLEAWSLDTAFVPALGWTLLGLLALTQALRYWTIAVLGRRWNVRVIVLPGTAAENSGPFRFLRHPNYLAVVVEGFAIPMVHGAWRTALGFSLLNAWLLSVRIRCEEGALARHCGYHRELEGRRRFWPAWPGSR